MRSMEIEHPPPVLGKLTPSPGEIVSTVTPYGTISGGKGREEEEGEIGGLTIVVV